MALRRNQHNYSAARRLRRDMSLPEVLLWQEVRRKAGGFKFRNQHPVGRYVVDFYCPAAKLAVEVDGIAHGMEIVPRATTSVQNSLLDKASRCCASPRPTS